MSSLSISSIPTNVASGVQASLGSAINRLSTATQTDVVSSLTKVIAGAQATLAIISEQQVLATATDTQAKESAIQAIQQASQVLIFVNRKSRFYQYVLDRFGNIFFTVFFGLLMVYYILMLWRSRYHWFNVTFIAGFAIEMVGYLARCLSFNDQTHLKFFLIQTICLMVAPAVLMAGVYFLTAQLIVIHGRQYSFLKPMWYSSIFISVDVISFLMQAGGGGLFNNRNKRELGKNIMIGGIAVQVIGMTFYLILFFDFLRKIYFKNNNSSLYSKSSFKNFFKLLFNAPSIRSYRREELDMNYNQLFSDLRETKIFNYFPLAMTIAVLLIYIRSVFRLVELSQGLDGELFSREVYLFTLDGMLILMAGIIFAIFHPVWVLGKEVRLKASTIKHNEDQALEENETVFNLLIHNESEKSKLSS
jgi:hypothetical protein